MATTAKLVAATQALFAPLMTTELNSLISGNAIIGATAVDNSTNLDLEIELSFKSGGSITTVGSPFLAVYLYPLNGDGTTYGDGRFGGSTTGPPGQSYLWGYIGGIPAATGTVSGYYMRPDGQGPRLMLPRGLWKPVFHNGLGVGLTATGNILYYKTTNLQLV